MSNPIDRVPFSIYKGSTFEYTFLVVDVNDDPVDISTGYTASMEFKDEIGGDVLYTATNATGEFTFPGANQLKLVIDGDTIADWDFESAVHDVFIRAGGLPFAIARGQVRVWANVTDNT